MKNNLCVVKKIELIDFEKFQLFNLWNQEYPKQITFKNIAAFENYLLTVKINFHLLCINNDNEIIAWAFSFERDKEKWFVIIVSEEFKNNGIGSKLLNELKLNEPILNGWVIDHNNDKKMNGKAYISPLLFYKKCGFEILKDTRIISNNVSAVKVKWSTKN